MISGGCRVLLCGVVTPGCKVTVADDITLGEICVGALSSTLIGMVGNSLDGVPADAIGTVGSSLVGDGGRDLFGGVSEPML
jgi:hypothetical protein